MDDVHTDWKKAHEGITEDVVKEMKREKRCTRCILENQTWRQCRKRMVVATTFVYWDRGNAKPHWKPRTSTLEVHNLPPSR